jgi:hypothetical protein
MLLNELYAPMRSHSEIDLMVTHARTLNRAWIAIDEDKGTAVVSFEVEGHDGKFHPAKIVVRAKPGISGKPGKGSLLSGPEVLVKRAKGAAMAQLHGHVPKDIEQIRSVLLGGVGNNALRRFLDPKAFDIISAHEGV